LPIGTPGRELFEPVDESAAFIEVVLLRRAGHPQPDHHGRAAVHPTALPYAVAIFSRILINADIGNSFRRIFSAARSHW
jgi:hypothetical protein